MESPLWGELRKTYVRLLNEREDKFLDYQVKENLGYGIQKCDEDDCGTTVASILHHVLISTDREVLEAVMSGDLPQTMPESSVPATTTSYRAARSTGLEERPVIYGNFLVNKETGEEPTYVEVEDVIQGYRKYLHDAELASTVDKMIGREVDISKSKA